MSEETKVPGTQAGETEAAPQAETAEASQPDAAPETSAQAEPAAEAPQPDGKKPEQGKQKKDWFGGKTAKELEATKAKLRRPRKRPATCATSCCAPLPSTTTTASVRRGRLTRNSTTASPTRVSQILGILDTLDMAANAACTDDNYKKGVVMTLDTAAKALEKLHVTEIEALGKPFDPNFMNAVQQVPPAEGQESGSVVQVYQKGYMIGDKVIRHATVVVAE